MHNNHIPISAHFPRLVGLAALCSRLPGAVSVALFAPTDDLWLFEEVCGHQSVVQHGAISGPLYCLRD